MADLHKLSGLMKQLFPSDPASDLAALQEAAKSSTQINETTIDYTKESAQVNEGSLPVDKNYTVSDFAKLAGVNEIKEDAVNWIRTTNTEEAQQVRDLLYKKGSLLSQETPEFLPVFQDVFYNEVTKYGIGDLSDE